MIVVDTNVIAYAVLPGPSAALASAVRKRDPIWHAPPLWHNEMLNVLAKQMAHAGASLQECAEAYQRAARLLVVSNPPQVHRVLELAAASGCTSYDCEFVAAAEEVGAQLVTADAQMLAAFPELAISPADFAA